MLRTGRCLYAAFLILNIPLGCAVGQTLDQAVTQLASRIMATVPVKSGLSLGIENISSLSTPEIVKVRDALQAELIRSGLQFDANSLTLIQVTVSENARGFLLIAQTPSADGTKVAMASWTRRAAQTAGAPTNLTKTLIVESASPILDISLTNGGAELWLLEPARLLHFTKTADTWSPDRTTSISASRPLPRDVRGKLTPEPRLPDSNAPWALDARHTVRWAAGRNYFFEENGSFYSAASIGNFEFKAGLDGRTRMTTAQGSLIANLDDWGSDLVALQGSCGEWFVIASAKSDQNAADHVQAYQVSESRPVRAGESLDFPGPVTAIWPAEVPAQATAVVRNRKTGNHEAYRVSIACGN